MIHTNQLRAGIYQRAHPDYTDQVETVEIWEKADQDADGGCLGLRPAGAGRTVVH